MTWGVSIGSSIPTLSADGQRMLQLAIIIHCSGVGIYCCETLLLAADWLSLTPCPTTSSTLAAHYL